MAAAAAVIVLTVQQTVPLLLLLLLAIYSALQLVHLKSFQLYPPLHWSVDSKDGWKWRRRAVAGKAVAGQWRWWWWAALPLVVAEEMKAVDWLMMMKMVIHLFQLLLLKLWAAVWQLLNEPSARR